jgi:signal transduction histidine kinase
VTAVAQVGSLLRLLARDGSSPAAIVPALDAFCEALGRLVAADRVRIWLHDRRARELVLAAGSEMSRADRTLRIPSSDQRSPIAAALGRDRAVLAAASRDTGLGALIGLRGRRRALGVMALEGMRVEPGEDAALLERLEETGRQLSVVLENVQLLDEIVRARAERADLERRLAQSEKLLALGQFVAGIAHELNNPLQGVLGHLELIRRTRLPRSLARDLALVYREADRAARIVRNLLVFAGSGRLTRRPLSLNRVASQVLSLRAARLRAAGIEVVAALDETLRPVAGDRLLLQQALVNLVVNAEQAMPDGGRLVVRTESAGDGARVIVTDNGRGMDEQVRARLFEPFFTTREESGGTGLGLSIVYGIVKAHGGAIDVESSPGMGASFRITLMPATRRVARG